jgi:UDP-N-acetylmuramate--alanine ligase
MVAFMLERTGQDPTAVIGGRLRAFGSNARLGGGDLMVAEADESDRSFLKLFPTIAVLTNIDHEHLESYGSFDDLLQAFVDFGNKVPFYGAVIACGDDPQLRRVLPALTRRLTTYGLGGDSDVTAADVTLRPLGVDATVMRRTSRGDQPDGGPQTLGRLSLQVPGRHNLQNALAAVAVGLELGLPFDRIAAALHGFRGVERSTFAVSRLES